MVDLGCYEGVLAEILVTLRLKVKDSGGPFVPQHDVVFFALADLIF